MLGKYSVDGCRKGGGVTSLWVAAIFVPLANKHIFMIFFTVRQESIRIHTNPRASLTRTHPTRLPPQPQVSAAIELHMNNIYTRDSVNKLQQQNRVAKGVRLSRYEPSGKISQFSRSRGLT